MLATWSKSFRKFLRRVDARWPELLDKVEALRGKPVTPGIELGCAHQLSLGSIPPWKEQLNEALGSFTASGARRVVDACDDRKALDAWRSWRPGFQLHPAPSAQI